MRGLRVMWSLDNLSSDAMKTQAEPGNPGARNTYPQRPTAIHR